MKTLSNTNRMFFEFTFNGNGKYYTTEQKSKTYGNTLFQNFYNKNADCIDIKESGNDAPRGGKTGNFVVVEFNENFFKKWQFALDLIKEKEQLKQDLADKKINAEKNIIAFIKENKELIDSKKAELDELKAKGEKEQWQIKANSLVQFVSKNDFSIGWSSVYTLIKNN